MPSRSAQSYAVAAGENLQYSLRVSPNPSTLPDFSARRTDIWIATAAVIASALYESRIGFPNDEAMDREYSASFDVADNQPRAGRNSRPTNSIATSKI